MIETNNIASTLAEKLLQIKAIKLSPQNPFTWASGWHSPIYCDNRKTLSYPDIRTLIKEALSEQIKSQFKGVDMIAGVATAGIPHGALVADYLNLPFIYVRSKPKAHGLTNSIEGEIKGGEKIVVIEDLISTGKSSLEVVHALKDAGCNILGLAAIFTYGFDISKLEFDKANCPFFTLSNYDALIELAIEQNYVEANELEALKAWRENPDEWGKN